MLHRFASSRKIREPVAQTKNERRGTTINVNENKNAKLIEQPANFQCAQLHTYT